MMLLLCGTLSLKSTILLKVLPNLVMAVALDLDMTLSINDDYKLW